MSEQASAQFDSAAIPETWDGVQSFAHWWCDAGMPFYTPAGSEVFLSDDATSICVFRQGRFQVELYLIHPNPNLQNHEHPDVEVIKMRVDAPQWGRMSAVLHNGENHGSGAAAHAGSRGFPLIAFQHWKERDPCTVAAAWRGPTVGPKQEALIRRFYPNAFIEPGYADVTKPVNYRELLIQGKA
jgi:hypothetical protein